MLSKFFTEFDNMLPEDFPRRILCAVFANMLVQLGWHWGSESDGSIIIIGQKVVNVVGQSVLPQGSSPSCTILLGEKVFHASFTHEFIRVKAFLR